MMKFDYNAYEKLFPRSEAGKNKTVIKDQEQGNVLEEAEADQKPDKAEPDQGDDNSGEGGVIDEEG